jgi:hypothetical protein
MPTLSVEISQEQEIALGNALDAVPGWNKALVIRALLAYFLGLPSEKQEELVRKHRVIQKQKK